MKGIFGRRAAAKVQETDKAAEVVTEVQPTAEFVPCECGCEQHDGADIVKLVRSAAALEACQRVVLPQAKVEPEPLAANDVAEGLEVPDLAINQGKPTATVEVESEDQPNKVEQNSDAKPEVAETIPLGQDEIKSLQDHRYDQIKDRFTKTFVIEKGFYVFVDNMDPTKPGRKPVRVKRVAEIKAANLNHALKMIGWDIRNVTIVDIKDEYQGDVRITVDGKVVSSVALPDGWEKFEDMGGGARKVFVSILKDRALADEKLKSFLKDKMLVVSGYAYQSRMHINFTTSFDKVARAAAKAKRQAAKAVAVPVPAQPAESPVAAPDAVPAG
jgi:hypothetical protein